MQVNITDPPDSGFFYEPSRKELRIVSGVSLELDSATLQFAVDRTPTEDADLVPIQNLAAQADYSRLSFEANHAGEQIVFDIVSRHRCDRILHEAICAIHSQAFSFSASDQDSIDLVCKDGSLQSLIVRKSGTVAGPYVHLFFGGDGVFKIIENPHARHAVLGLRFHDDLLTVETDGGNCAYRFGSQEFLIALVRDFLGGDREHRRRPVTPA